MLIRAKDASTELILNAAANGDVDYLKKQQTRKSMPCDDNHISSHHCDINSNNNDKILQARCVSGCTALHWAAGCNQISTILYLIHDLHMDVNILATKQARGRTPLHYSCRNGCFDAAKTLVQLGANVDATAKHGVSPFQLAVWQNHVSICKWLVEEQKVDPLQVNDFNCGAVHWLGICPKSRANINIKENETKTIGIDDSIDHTNDSDGSGLIPLAVWLAQHSGIDFHLLQRQGHTPLHKAAWGGHLALIRYMVETHGLIDDVQDYAGNFAADLADMATTDQEEHTKIAQYLREQCSGERAKSCDILGIPITSDTQIIRRAYLKKAKELHPDKKIQYNNNNNDSSNNDTTSTEEQQQQQQPMDNDEFDLVRKAYDHLTIQNGFGSQSNPAHSLNLMIELNNISPQKNDETSSTISSSSTTNDHNLKELSLFKARLVAVLLEFGDKGIELCNIKKKWKQVWPNDPFPDIYEEKKKKKKKKGQLASFIQKYAGDVVDLQKPEHHTGSLLVVPTKCTRASVDQAVSTII